MKVRVYTITSAFLLVSLGIYLMGYHGPRDFSGILRLPPVTAVIENARSLAGVPYDPLMGMYGNIGASAGFVVCSDIPNIAYGLSGYSWKDELEKDYITHSKFYDSDKGNRPENNYFHRRARNLYSYFLANGRLKTEHYIPRVGDMVFYRKSENGYIAHVALVTHVTSTGYRLMESAPKTLFAQDVSQDSPIERGWKFAGIGSVYGGQRD